MPKKPPPPPPPPSRSGALLGGKYEPVAPAAEGGMASIWLGYTHGEAGFRRRVAIKRVLRHLASDEKFEQMFVQEAHIVAELNHPNIAQIHDFGRDAEGGYFIVMEWVSGLSLADYVRAFALARKPTPWPLMAAVGIEALRALSAAHLHVNAAGAPAPVIHRDVTPSNVMIGHYGAIKLTDFGLSRATYRPRTTDPNLVKGKIAYMAPELFERSEPDPRCDLFSLGVTLWEAVAGQRLFGGRGTDVDTALRVLECKVPRLADYRTDVPQALEAILLRAVTKSPAERFQSATEMIDAFASLLRAHGAPTDGPAIARSVREAGDYLAELE